MCWPRLKVLDFLNQYPSKSLQQAFEYTCVHTFALSRALKMLPAQVRCQSEELLSSSPRLRGIACAVP